MDYKKTLLMPNTNFEMKANLKQKEKYFRKIWMDKNIYQKVLIQNKNNKSFILHDGPPYANGDLHVGHALNKILKDIIVRRKNMEGFYAPYLFGWDTHGLPIENKMLAEMNMQKDDLDKNSLRKAAAKYALTQIKKQKFQFEKMQLFASLEKNYLTLSKEFEVAQLKLFKKMVLDGLIYKGLKPVYWSPSSQSALAEAEVEYKNYISPQIIVALKISKGNNFLKINDNLLIMTTTPWTLIANAGVGVNQYFKYVIIKAKNKKYVVEENLVEDVANKCKWKKFIIFKKINGKDLLGIEYVCPIKKKLRSYVVSSDYVTNDIGTGLVHIAPLFGEDDYLLGKKEKLNMIMHVDDKGYFNKNADKYYGKFYEDANKDIGMQLNKDGNLLSLKFLKHSYPHDWRTEKPIIYRGVPQWFVNIKNIKKQIINELKKIKSFPKWGTSMLLKMIENRNEWTISRQRTWGVPIIIFYDKNKKPVIKEELFDYVINLVSKNGTDIWWEKETDELLPKKYRKKGFTKEMDIMDVWFDSGSSSIAVKIEGHEAPFDLYLEGSDQYRGWFNSSLINSIAYRKQAPFKMLISHGFVVNDKQEKMSKSKGNVINPLEIIQKNGADVLRLWVANSEYTSDVTISNQIIEQTSNLYRKFRNTIRFILGNLKDFNYNKNSVQLKGFHMHIQNKLRQYNNSIIDYYNNYNFSGVVKETNKFFVELSNWYFNYAKDILYCDKQDDIERRAIQTNMFNILLIVLKLLAPIIPTTIEEAYYSIPNYNHKESIFLEKINNQKFDISFNKKWLDFENIIRPKINILIENQIKNNIIKRSNELILYVKEELEEFAPIEIIAKILLVAKIKFSNVYKVKKFLSIKCKRCWNHFEKKEIILDICVRCNNVLRL